jgi:hypothetical protein
MNLNQKINRGNMRTDQWLEDQLNQIWQSFFPDIHKVNNVVIKWGRAAKNQLGSITAKGPRRLFRTPGRFPKHSWWLPESISIITINRNFQNLSVPEEIISVTIAHELVHYSHGFSSPHPQLYKYPHLGGIVSKELKARGLGDQLKFQKKWLKEEWKKYHDKGDKYVR